MSCWIRLAVSCADGPASSLSKSSVMSPILLFVIILDMIREELLTCSDGSENSPCFASQALGRFFEIQGDGVRHVFVLHVVVPREFKFKGVVGIG